MKKIILLLTLLAAVLLGFLWLKEDKAPSPIKEENPKEKVEKLKSKRHFKELAHEKEKQNDSSPKENVEKRIRASKEKPPKKKLTPEESMKKMMKQIITATYGDFFKEMNFPKETEEALSNHLTENQMLLQKLMEQLLDPSITDEEIVRDQAEKRATQQGKMDSIINASEQESLKHYQKEIPVKTAKKIIPAMFNFDWENMSESQKNLAGKTWINVNSKGLDKSLAQAQNAPFVTGSNVKAVRKNLNDKQKQATNPNEAMKEGRERQKEYLEAMKAKGIEPKK